MNPCIDDCDRVVYQISVTTSSSPRFPLTSLMVLERFGFTCVDLRKDWNYNTRSIYVYAVVSYEGDKVSYALSYLETGGPRHDYVGQSDYEEGGCCV